MNAITPLPPDPMQAMQARHLEVIAELQAMGLRLARIAERAAARAAEAAEAAPDALPDPKAIPPDRTARVALRWVRTATRLGRDVRLLIVLERRIAAGELPTPWSSEPSPPRPPDPRRAMLRHALNGFVDVDGLAATQREALRTEIDVRVDAALAADPAGGIPAGALLLGLADAMGMAIEVDAIGPELRALMVMPELRDTG